jgi:ribokinase
MSRVAVIGSINTDLVARSTRFPVPGETVLGESFAVYGGGKGANQAIAAARAGGTVEFFGAVGRDPYSIDRIQQFNIDSVGTSNVVESDGYGGIAVILVEESSGQNVITLIPGANSYVTGDVFIDPLKKWCRPGDIICLQLEIPLESVEAALSLKREYALTTVLNAAPFDSRAIKLLPMVDYLVVNEIEAGQLTGQPRIAPGDAAAVGKRLLGAGVAVAVVITLGSAGALFIDARGATHFPAERVSVVDTTAAGDAFAGVFCASLADGLSAADATRAAVVAGTLAVQKHGAQPSLPTAVEIREALAAR